MTTRIEWGPLAALIGAWEGDEGVDVAFQHAVGEIGETRYHEQATFSPFGPVDNGPQALYGLDYRMAARREDEDNPFHTEIGYWLWDGAAEQVLRCFVVPRGSMVLAGGPAEADATTFTLQAGVGSETYGILSNQYLAQVARTVLYQCTITLGDDGTLSYEQKTTIDHARCDGPLEHTDTNRLRRVS